MKEESFAPLFSVMAFDSEEQVIEIANNSKVSPFMTANNLFYWL
jgi:acyl-CoA reductase-like NAD-dependent aldehyde dehydrogenase